MNPKYTTMTISDSIEALELGQETLTYSPDHPNTTDIAIGMLGTVGALMNKFTPDHFTDDEIDLITDTIVLSTETLNGIINTYEENDDEV